jgi:hypothetical protein
MLQLFDFERFLFDPMIRSDQKVLKAMFQNSQPACRLKHAAMRHFAQAGLAFAVPGGKTWTILDETWTNRKTG